MYYVYILNSIPFSNRFYTGFTENLEQRLIAHNSGEVSYTAKFLPWKIKTFIAFTSREQALRFEQYLKTKSGRAFATKRL
ncbi:MAG: GIY-YIG nuclease family protein [Candidatus Margulisbacteria bacterium]|nr:GIY-YIG nuclease family protein [Candidatus Margulisiibacteriota bacterium]